MNLRMILTGVMALALIFAGTAVTKAGTVLFDDFDDDSGVLTGEMANTGQTWTTIPTRTALDIGTQFGQSGNGAGNDNTGSSAWKANEISLGQVVNDGIVVISADFRKQHIAGPINEMNFALTSSTQNKTTALIWAADWVKIGGSWAYGGGQINTGIPVDVRVELTLNLVDGGANTATISFEEIGNPANSNSLALGSIVGTLNYDTFEIWANTRSGKIVGFDNVSVTVIPEPLSLSLLVLAGLMTVLVYRRNRNS